MQKNIKAICCELAGAIKNSELAQCSIVLLKVQACDTSKA